MAPQDLTFLDRYHAAQTADQPKHARLSGALLAAIGDGHWPPGGKLPTEQQLARATPYSLGTVQRAMRSLVDSGVVVRRQGAGSFVAARERRVDDPWHFRFVADDGISFVPAYPRVVLRDRLAGPGPWCTPLKMSESEEVVQVDRRVDIGGEFAVYSRFFTPAEPYGTLLYRPLAELDGVNIRNLLLREMNVVVTRITQDIRLVTLPDTVAKAIAVEAGTTGMFLQAVASMGGDRPVYYQELFVPPNGRRLHISEFRAGSAG